MFSLTKEPKKIIIVTIDGVGLFYFFNKVFVVFLSFLEITNNDDEISMELPLGVTSQVGLTFVCILCIVPIFLKV